jgi:hypothetical protein
VAPAVPQLLKMGSTSVLNDTVGDCSADPVTQGTNGGTEEAEVHIVVLPALPPVLQFPPLPLELLLEQAMTVAKTAPSATAASVPRVRSM